MSQDQHTTVSEIVAGHEASHARRQVASLRTMTEITWSPVTLKRLLVNGPLAKEGSAPIGASVRTPAWKYSFGRGVSRLGTALDSSTYVPAFTRPLLQGYK